MNLQRFRRILRLERLKDIKFDTSSVKSILLSWGSNVGQAVKTNRSTVDSAVSIVLGLTIGLGVVFMGPRSNGAQLNVFNDNSEGSNYISTEAERLFYNRQYDKAVKAYLKIIDSDKTSPIWYLKVSEIYSVKGEIGRSRRYIQLAKDMRNANFANKGNVKKISRDEDIEVLNYIIFNEFMNKDFKEAMQDGEASLKEYKNSKKLMKTMIPVYMANNEINKAKLIVSLYPMNMKSAYDIAEHARMNLLVDQWDDGLNMLKLSWYVDRDEYKIFDILAQVAVYNKDVLLEKISGLSSKSPGEPAYKVWLAKIYSMDEETSDMAQQLLDEVKKKNIGKIEKVLIQSAIYQNTKQLAKADQLITQLIEEKGDDYRILHTAGWYYLQKGSLNKAVEYCNESIDENRNYPDNYGFLMPEILKSMGKDIEVEPYFRTALLKEPYNYNIMLNIANYYWYTTKSADKAINYFKLAEIVKPNDPEIKYNMAIIHLTNKKVSEAIELLKKSIKLDPAVPKYHRTLGTIYMTQGKYAEGIAEIRNAYQADQGDILALNNAGSYYITVTQELEKGLYNFQKAYDGIGSISDEYIKKSITENYNKAKKLVEDYNKGQGGETLKIPDFILFY